MNGIDQVIASFYECAAGRSDWRDALDALAARLNCFVIQIIGVDKRRGGLTYSYENRAVPPGSVLDYALHYHRIDPHVERLAARPVGELVAFSKVLDERFVSNSRFYQEFLIPYGVRHMHAARLFDDGEKAALIGIMRSPDGGVLDGEQWALAQRACFHLSHALGIFEDRTLDRAHVAIGQAILDRIVAPMWILNDRGTVLRRNESADSSCDSGIFVRENSLGRLQLLSEVNDSRFLKTLRELAAASPQVTNDAKDRLDRAVIAIPSDTEGIGVILRLMAVRPDSCLHAFG